jgi:hypothetical protein
MPRKNRSSQKAKKKVKAEHSSRRAPKRLPESIAPADYLDPVWTHLTEEACHEVFEATRDRERQRKWTLSTLMRVWMGLLQNPTLSQTEAIEICAGGKHALFPKVEASSESFFMRIASLRPTFFRNLFLRFTIAIQCELALNFASDLSVDVKAFPEIYVIDGSRLAKVGRVLKVARNTTKAIIPGSMEALYDLRRGVLRDLWFDPDGARSEMAMLDQVLGSVQEGALLINDRYYPKPVIWRKMADKKLWMVSRYNATVKKRKLKSLRKVRNSKVTIDDWLVEMGGSQYNEEPVTLRWVHVRNGDFDLILITNVVDPKLLSVEQLLELYGYRWSVERMYLHLKEVLALNRLFNASPSAVGQQTYATAILYNALRLAQSKIALKLKIPPERFSPDKLFPKLIERLVQRTWLGQGAEWQRERSGIEQPSSEEWREMEKRLSRHPALKLNLEGVFVQKRAEFKRKRRFCKGRKTWTTYRKIPGAKKLLRI